MVEPNQERRYGARISGLDGRDVILVQQTSRLHPGAGNNPYTIDQDEQGNNIDRHVQRDNDAEIAQAVRDALAGQL